MNINLCEKCKHFEVYNFYPRIQWFCQRNTFPDDELKHTGQNLIAQSNNGTYGNWIVNARFKMPDNCPYILEHVIMDQKV